MNRRVKKMPQNSKEENHLRNGINVNPSNWSRCNSFSSSSNDSTVFCSSHLKRQSFTSKKRLAIEDSSTMLSKRTRNSSGSSASSNISCFSDKDTKSMPLLVPADSVPTNNKNVENLTRLSDISSTAFSLQHETLLNNRLSHSISMDSILPFRHNLRRNIRKKTCSCDCTATCTTVVVSRQYKGVGQKTVEKTVISRTKVKTYVERKPPERPPANKNQTPVSISPKINSSSKIEPNRKRRSEIEKLYDSLHEIKWAKNFSPDNILRQFDVRQAASCSVFGKSPDIKCNTKSRTSNQRRFSFDSKITPKESFKSATVNSTSASSLRNNTYRTRSRSRLPQNAISNTSPPVLEKSILNNDDLSTDSVCFSSYPILSKEVYSPETDLSDINNKSPSKQFELSSSFNSLQTSCSTCTNVNFPKILSFDLNSQSNIENINNCAFFDIAEEEIRTIDACFREVGAEVVVSTCYEETDYSLPELTSVEEISLEKSQISNDFPPILKPLTFEKSHDENLSIACSNDNVSGNYSKLPGDLDSVNCSFDSIRKPLSQTFSPTIDSKSLPEEDYSPPEICLNKMKDFQVVKTDVVIDDNVKAKPSLPCLKSIEDSVSFESKSSFEREPPVLESCLESAKKDSLCSKRNFRTIQKSNCGNGDKISVNKKTHRNAKCSNEYKKICKNVSHYKKASLITTTAKCIRNKYLKLLHSKYKSQYKPLNISKGLHKNNETKELKPSLNDGKNNLQPNKTLPCVSPVSSHKLISHTTSSKIMNSSSLPFKSPHKTSESIVKKENFISSVTKQQSSESVTNADGATVIRTFDQKLSFSESPEKVTLNRISNSSIYYKSKSEHNESPSLKAKRGRKSLNINNNQELEDTLDLSGYVRILTDSKKKNNRSSEAVKLPPRIFTCHYQAINVTHGSNYIQIVLKITRGKSVFLTRESLIELKEAITKAGKDNDCKLVILNGFGKTFCLGLDLLPIIGEHKNQVVGEIANAIKDLISTLADFNKPLVAIVNGAAFGLGLTLLNYADVALATKDASFCMPYSKLGYMPEGGATLTLPQAVGSTVAMDLILRGQEITAQQAREIGLINEVVELKHLPKDLVRRVQTMADDSSPGMEVSKAMMKMRLHIQLPLILETEAKLLPEMWLSTNCQEAIRKALDSGFLSNC